MTLIVFEKVFNPGWRSAPNASALSHLLGFMAKDARKPGYFDQIFDLPD
jgi:hypothetical protein